MPRKATSNKASPESKPSFPLSRILSPSDLVRQIIESNSHGSRFCFILGSGASVESGIPSGASLEMKWMNCMMGDPEGDPGYPPMDPEKVQELAYNLFDEEQIEHPFEKIKKEWEDAKANKRSMSSEYYFDIYKLRFHPRKENGYRYMEKIMEKCEPSIGYHPLALLLTKTDLNNLVITTNFDNLVEDALFIYTEKKPLVASHESLAVYIDADIKRPIIAKVHRGIFFEPKNTPEDTSSLSKEWTEALTSVFHTYIPIVIGYGGGDRSLMDFLQAPTTDMRKGIFWCFRGELPDQKILDLVNRHNGCLVRIDGFDSLMLKVGDQLYKEAILPSSTGELLSRQNKKRIDRYEKQFNDLNQRPEMQEVMKPLNEALKNDESKREQSNSLTSWDYIRRGKQAYNEHNYPQAITAFTKAIELDANFEEVYNLLSEAYSAIDKPDKAIAISNTSIEINPSNAISYYVRGMAHLGKEDYSKAIEDFSYAINLDKESREFLNARGVAYLKNDKPLEAINDFTEAIRLDITYADAYSNRGVAYYKNGLNDKAKQDFTNAIRLNPDAPNPHYHLGHMYLDQKDYQDAISELTVAISLDNYYTEAYLDRAKAYEALSETRLANYDKKYARKLQTVR